MSLEWPKTFFGAGPWLPGPGGVGTVLIAYPSDINEAIQILSCSKLKSGIDLNLKKCCTGWTKDTKSNTVSGCEDDIHVWSLLLSRNQLPELRLSFCRNLYSWALPRLTLLDTL